MWRGRKIKISRYLWYIFFENPKMNHRERESMRVREVLRGRHTYMKKENMSFRAKVKRVNQLSGMST